MPVATSAAAPVDGRLVSGGVSAIASLQRLLGRVALLRPARVGPRGGVAEDGVWERSRYDAPNTRSARNQPAAPPARHAQNVARASHAARPGWPATSSVSTLWLNVL